jgi:hypothetical protein
MRHLYYAWIKLAIALMAALAAFAKKKAQRSQRRTLLTECFSEKTLSRSRLN